MRRRCLAGLLDGLDVGCEILKNVFPIIYKAADKLRALAALGHYPTFVMFAMANIAEIRVKPTDLLILCWDGICDVDEGI